MEEKKTIFDHLGHICCTYGITIVILNALCLLFGEGAREISDLFALGNKGLTIEVMLQFLGVMVFMDFYENLFFSNWIIKRAGAVSRTIGMISCILITIAAFASVFNWFPVDMWLPWVMFLLCFAMCFLISVGVTFLKERLENKRMEEALRKLQEKNNSVL